MQRIFEPIDEFEPEEGRLYIVKLKNEKVITVIYSWSPHYPYTCIESGGHYSKADFAGYARLPSKIPNANGNVTSGIKGQI